MRAKTRTSSLSAVRPLLALFVVGLVLCTLTFSIFQPGQKADAATNGTINFQARLMNSAGSIVADGDYNIEFKLYNTLTSSGSSQGSCTGDANCLWSETRVNTDKVHVANGYLTVNLGSVTSFASTINWDQDMWLTMRVGGTGTPSWDTEMTPRLKLTGVPYAFRAGQLAKLAGSNTAILEFASSFGQNTTITLPDPVAGTATVCYQGSTACGFATITGGNFIQNGTTVQTNANFNIRSAATGSVGGVIQGANGQTADLLQLQTYDGSTSTNVFAVSVAGVVTLNGGQSIDVTTASAATANGMVFQPGVSSAATTTGAGISVRGGNVSGTTTVTAGSVTIQGGNATGGSGTRNGGVVTIDGGTGGTAATNGAINVGTANAPTVNIGSVGTTAKATAINIGTTTTTTAGAIQSITIGSNSNLAHTTIIQGGNSNTAGSEAIRLVPQTTGAIAIGSTTGTGTITLGQSTAANTINIGNANFTAANTQTINIANGNQTTAASTLNVNILSGAAGSAGTGRLNLANNDRVTQVDIGNVVSDAARTLNVFTGNATAVDTINIGTGAGTVAGAKTVNIANGTPTGSGTNLVTIGTVANASTTTIQGGTGSGAVSIQSGSGGTISIGTSGVANTVQIGNTSGGVSQAINIGNNATSGATNNVTIGTTSTSQSVVTINGGTGSNNNVTLQTNNAATGVLVKSLTNSTNAFQVQNASGTNGILFNIDTANGWIINNSVMHPGNLLENPSFEANGAFMLSGWNHNSQSAITVDSTNAHHGNNVMVSTPNSTLFTISSLKYLEAVPGDQFYADIWYKSSGTTNGTASFSFSFYDKDRANIGSSSATNFTAANTTYTRAVVNGTAPANTAYVRLSIGVNATSTTGTWYFDDLTISKTTEASPKLFKNAVNSTTALAVQNANGDIFFNADTSGNNIAIGYTSSTTNLNGTVKVTTIGAATGNSQALCRDSVTFTLTACSGSLATDAFVQGGNTFGAVAVLGTNDANNLQFETNNVVRATFDQSNGLYLGNGVTNATPNNFTVSGTGSSTAGTAGANLTLKGGAGASATTGSIGGNIVIQGGAAGGSGNNNGGDVLIQGGAPANSGSGGQVIVRNGADTTGAFQVQNAAGNSTILNVDTVNGRVGVGGVASFSKFEVLGGDAAVYNSGNNPRLVLGDSTSGGQNGYLQWDSASDYFRIETVGTNGLKINDNYLAIGNIFPNQPLIVGNGTTNLFQISTGGVATLIGGQTADLTTATAATATALTLQPGISSAATTTGAALNLRGGDVSGTTSVTGGALSLLAGSATGGSGTRNGGSVTIDAGTGATANGSINIGTANAVGLTLGRAAGTTTIQGTVKVSTLGASTANSAAVCRDTSTTNLIDCDANTSGKPFLQGGNTFAATGVLGTNDANNLQFETNNIVRATFDQSNALYLGLGITHAAPTAFTLSATGSSAAGAAGAKLTVQGGAGSSATTGSAGGDLDLKGGNAGGSGNNAGGNVTLGGGSRTGTGAVGGVVVKNTTDSANAFRVQNSAGSSTVLGVDTTNSFVGVGTAGAAPSRTLHVAVNNTSTSSPNLLVEQSGSGDTGIEVKNASNSYYLGIDTSDSSRFKLSSSTAAGSSTTFGVTTIGGSTDSGDQNFQNASKFTTGAAGTLNSISVYINSGSAANQYSVAIYADDGAGTSRPSTLIASGSPTTIIPNSWNTVPVSASLTAGTVYWLAFNTNDATANMRYAAVANNGCFLSRTFALGWNPSFAGCTLSNQQFSIYANYTVAGGTDHLNAALFSVGQSGDAIFRNSSNSTAAFQVQNAAGTNMILADTSASILTLGMSAGTTTLQGTVKVSTLGATTANAVSVCRDSSTTNLIACDANTTGKPFLQGGNTFGAAGDLGTNDNFNLNFRTNGTTKLTLTAAGDLQFASGANRLLGVDTQATLNTAGVGLTVRGATGNGTGGGGTVTIQGGGGGATGGGGALMLNGGNAGGGNTNGGDITVAGGTGAGTGIKGVVNIGPMVFSAATTQSFAGGGTITQANVNNFSTVVVEETTTAGATVALPDPSNSSVGRTVYVTSTTTSLDFTLTANAGNISIAMRKNATATMIWNGADWTPGGADSSTTLQAAYNNTLISAGGAEIVLNNNSNTGGLTIRDNATSPIAGSLLEVQSAIGSNVFSVNDNSSELTANGGGEDSSTFATNWTAATGGTITRTTTANNYATGQAGVQVVTTTNLHGVRNNMAANPASGSTYQVSFTGKAVTSNFSTLDIYYSRDGGTSLDTCATGQTLVTTGFTKITCTFVAGGAATNADLIIRQSDGTGRTFYIDNLSVTLAATSGGIPSNVQIGGGVNGGQVSLLTLDRSAGAPVSGTNNTYLGSLYYDTAIGRIQCYESDGWGSCGSAPDNIIILTPEFAGATLNGTGIGTMTSDFCANQAGVLSVNNTLCGSGEGRNYYQWTSPQGTQQIYSIYLSYKLPSTFKNFADDSTIQLTGRTDNTSNGFVTYEVFKSTGSAITACGTETAVTTSVNTWQTVSINGNENTTCAFGGGNTVVFKINVKSQSDANVYVGNLTFTYTNN